MFWDKQDLIKELLTEESQGKAVASLLDLLLADGEKNICYVRYQSLPFGASERIDSFYIVTEDHFHAVEVGGGVTRSWSVPFSRCTGVFCDYTSELVERLEVRLIFDVEVGKFRRAHLVLGDREELGLRTNQDFVRVLLSRARGVSIGA
jgi:hypothetical protein